MTYSSPQTPSQANFIGKWLHSVLADKKAKEVFGNTDTTKFINAPRTRLQAHELIRLLQELDSEATEDALFRFQLEINSI